MTRLSPAVFRAAAVLDFFADHPLQTFTLTEVARSLKLSVATCHGILAAFVEVGYLHRNDDRSYVLGPRLVSIGRVANQYYSPLAIARPLMRKLADEFDAVCTALAREGDEMVTRERAASASHVGWALTEEVRRPLRPPIGIPFMTWSPQAEIDAWLARTSPPADPQDIDRRRSTMQASRDKGFCVALAELGEGERERGDEVYFSRDDSKAYLVSDLDPSGQYRPAFIAAPVFNASGRVDFALALIAFTTTFSGQEIDAMGRRVRADCDRITDYLAQPRTRRDLA